MLDTLDTRAYSVPFVFVIQNNSKKYRRVKLFSKEHAHFEPEGLMIYKLMMTEDDNLFSEKNHNAYLDFIKSVQEITTHIIGKLAIHTIKGGSLSENLDCFALYIKYKDDCKRERKFIEYPVLIDPCQFRDDCVNYFPKFSMEKESDIELGESMEYITFIIPTGQKMMISFYPAISGERDVATDTGINPVVISYPDKEI